MIHLVVTSTLLVSPFMSHQVVECSVQEWTGVECWVGLLRPPLRDQSGPSALAFPLRAHGASARRVRECSVTSSTMCRDVYRYRRPLSSSYSPDSAWYPSAPPGASTSARVSSTASRNSGIVRRASVSRKRPMAEASAKDRQASLPGGSRLCDATNVIRAYRPMRPHHSYVARTLAYVIKTFFSSVFSSSLFSSSIICNRSDSKLFSTLPRPA
mmetsp:Transcript_18969/g.53236  ORF Transcript_18969/g.53236 Transcript_18969/m.53236 type:complete len:213 (-) Transcript_18969:647-1285(-)